KSTFPTALDLRGMRIVVDCAHGATYHVAPHVFHELGADVETIGVEPDGFNINSKAGTVHPEALKKAGLDQKACLGIALDGRRDPLLVCDGDGRRLARRQLLCGTARGR